MTQRRELSDLRDSASAARQLRALEALEFGIAAPEDATRTAQRALLGELRERPLAGGVLEACGSAAASVQKQLRFVLSRYFLERFWSSQRGRLLGAWTGLATGRYEPVPRDLVLAIERHVQPSQRALELPEAQRMLSALASSLELLFGGGKPPKADELHVRLRALMLPLIASTWFAALDWEATEASQASDHAWSNYLLLLRGVEDHYPSPAVHYRAGVEGYCALLASILQDAARAVKDPAELARFIVEDVRSDLVALAGGHMLSIAAVDEECRAGNRAPVWAFAGAGRSLRLQSEALPRISRRMHELRARPNTRGPVRLGCPFMSLRRGLSDLHVQGFSLLARRWLA